MELLHEFKQNGYFTASLYHLLANKKFVDVQTEITPSEYLKEMKMGTAERLQSLHNIDVDNIVGIDKSRVVLSFTPKLLIFQNYKTNDKVVTKFSVKNISKAPTYLSMVFKESSYFVIKAVGGKLLSRLAPGISVTFSITFQPDKIEDYIHQVKFYTDVDEYVLPLIAIGPRPLIYLPDQVIIPTGPLKVENHSMIIVQNIGLVPAGLSFTTRSPFAVQPKSIFLNLNEIIDVRIGFKTMYLGETKGVLNVVLETGEIFRINVIGSTHLVSVELEKQTVRFLDTYNTMIRQQTLKINNKSDYLLTYACMKNDSVFNDFEDKVKLATMFYNIKDIESAKANKLIHYDVLSSDEHERVYTRIFYDEIQALVADKSLFFQSSHFSISPINGKIWPNKSSELTITFCPNEIGNFQVTTYLDIDGISNRIPLLMSGTSLPPSITLNLETLDMDRVYINKTYNYEIVAKNKGHINGTVLFKEVSSLFGSTISCNPKMRCLRPGEMDIFVISFCNKNQGPFFEEINFPIRDTDVVLKVYLKGVMVYPTLTFSLPRLDFGLVSLGVPKTLQLEATNDSTVQVDASVKIPSDGPEISSIMLKDYAVADKPKPQIPQWPKEFNIEPSKISIEPESSIVLKITLTPNLIRTNQTYLEVEMDKSDNLPIVLAVTYEARVTQIIAAPNIKLGLCYLDSPYKEVLSIKCNEFWGYFTLDEPEKTSSLVVDAAIKEGFLEPSSDLEIPIVVKTSDIGYQECDIRFNLFGLAKPVQVCHIEVTGVQPIVTASPTALHWGHIKLLTNNQKVLTLCNDSPVVINFKITLMHKDDKLTFNPSEGQIPPDGEVTITFSLCLIDADTYLNKAIIQMENVNDLMIPLSATGVGTSITVGENKDRIELGKNFTRIPLNCKVIMENCGTRMHALEWSEYYKPPKTKQHVTGCFGLEPRVLKLAPGEKLELTITGISNKVTTVKETWYLMGSVEGINKKELLLECPITVEFVDPKIEVSAPTLDFRYDFGPYSEYYKLTDIVTIKNVSRLSLDLEISTKSPFAVIQKQSSYKILPYEENLCNCICYNESDINVSNVINEYGTNGSKILIDYLTLAPVDVRKKSVLNFFEDINKLKEAFNLTYYVEERLDDQELMKLHVLFDTSKHTSLKSRIYSDFLKIKFKGHKNKDAIKLVGEVNHPNILILTPEVDFQSVLNNSIESKIIKIQNISPLLLCYKLKWKKYSLTMDSELSLQKLADYESTYSAQRHSKTDLIGLKEIMSPRTPAPSEIFKTERDSERNFNVPPIFSYQDDIEVEKKIMKRISPIVNLAYDSKCEWFNKLPREEKHHNNNINEILRLVPHRGLLKPNDIQYVHVIFKPTNNVNIRALLECDVLGGPSEFISIHGQGSDLSYALSSKSINFKIRSFHDCATEKFILSNTSQLSFQYKTYFNERPSESELCMTILNISPNEKYLKHNEEIEIVIEVRPGVMGYFKKTFLLEVGHLPFIPIDIFGWGVVPQVYLDLPRLEILKTPVELGYQAISTLTQEYLDVINETLTDTGTTGYVNTPLTDKYFEDHLFQDDWYSCSIWEKYPTIMDIELAEERVLVTKYIEQHPNVLSIYKTGPKKAPLPGFYTTPYLLDFGVVITGNTVQRAVDVINYGPISTTLKFAKGTSIPTWLKLKLSGKINPGEIGKLEISFSPNLNDFKELEQKVELSFNLEVPYGVSVPVHIKALCALPYLRSNVNVVNFGSVRCGDKIIHSIPLKNIGRPTCIWYASLKVKSQGFNPLTILTTSGKFGPGEGGWLNMAFKPTMEMDFEGLLVLTFHMNPNRLVVPVFGKCILPQVSVIGSNVVFPPTLPYAETSYIYFGLTNPCPFPIELIFAHNDTKWREEEEIYQLLYNYYNKPEEMLVPVQAPGLGLPQEIINFYLNYKEAIKRQEEIELSKGVAQTRPTAAAKKTRSPKTPVKTTQIKETSSQEQPRTDVEIAAEVMKNMKDQNIDPLRDAQSNGDSFVIEKCNARQAKGILIFVHGSPCEEMECKEIAYSIGKSLRIPTVNIDNSIVEALCVSNCAAKFAILASINEFYEESLQKSITKSDLSDKEEYPEYKVEETDDEFDSLWKKLELFVVAKSITTTRSNKKKKLSNSSLPTQPGTSTVFPFELLQELVTDFFMQPKFEKGFVVDTLTSVIIKSPPLVLKTVLKCKPAIWKIHLILCHSDFMTWAQAYQEAQQAPDIDEKDILNLYDEGKIDNIIESFEEMNDSEYETADPALKQIYTAYGLEARRKKYFEKKGYRTESKTQDEKIRDRSKSNLVSEVEESKKKIKKEDVKEKPTSDFLLMNTKYNNYVHAYENLINIANNWIVEECDVGQPLYSFNGQVVGAINKKANTKSEKQILASETSFVERGFPLTIIKCPCLQYKNAILNMFARSVTVQEALKEEEPYNILKSPVSRKEYSVLLPKTFPVLNIEETLQWIFLDEQPIKKCECNDMTDLYVGDDTNQDNVLNIISKWHCTCGKRMVSSQTSTNEIPLTSTDFTADGSKSDIISLPFNCIKSLLDLKSRIILEPGDLLRCKYAFSPQVEGHFSSKRFVEVCGWPNSRVDINASGICDLPRLDSRPKKMFQSFVRHTTEDRIYKGTFLDDQKIFEFGPIFIGNSRIYEEKSLITLKNTSLITTDIEIEFLEDISTFQVDKTNVRLQPGCKDIIWILAAPTEIGVHKCVLLFCIRDNPEIITINITCTGVLPFVEILPESKTIDFGKHLLYRREHERFIVMNNSILPIKWKIRNAKDFAVDFIIDQQAGIVQREDNQIVPLTYIACRVGTISDKTLIIDIYDAEGRGTPMLTGMLHLSAECYDVLIDCVYKDPTKNSLDYGNVKINSTEVRDIYLLNRGKYSIYFKLKKVKSFPEPSLLRSLRAYPEHGVIPPTLKPLTIEFECTPTTSMNLINVPAYTCSLLDDSRNQVVVAKFPVYLTIASFYNTFTLFPKGELTFPIIPVGTGIVRDLILSNTSKCPFTYEIVLPKKYEDSDVTLVSKAKDTRLKKPALKCGNFLIFTDDNLLAPGTNRTLKIQFTASAAETFEETIYFVVSDTCPEEAKGVPFKLVGTGSIPSLDFWNIETTFKEHLIVKKISEYKIPESCAHCVFVEDSVTLHFFCVTINTNHAARIDLFNNGIVACALNMKLHYQSNCNQEIFSLDRYQTYIEPLVHKNLVINFNPKELVEYRAVLEIRLKLLDNQEQIFKICLIGEGVIPRVDLIYPHFVRPGLALLHFLPTCLGSVSCKEIRIKNVSCVKTLVTANVLYNFNEERPIFWITVSPNVQSENNQGDFNLSIQKVLEPEDIGLFYLHFNPIKRGKITCDVEFRIYDNPFEQFTVLCDAEAFMEDIILVGLEMLPMDIDLDTYKTSVEGTVSTISLSDNKKKSRSTSFDKRKLKISEQKRSKRTLRPLSKYSDTETPSGYSIEHNLLKYILDFGGCELFSIKKRALSMVNNSEKVYKFKWEEVECIVVKPSVGYISPGEEKDLEILFYSPQPVVINKELLFLHMVAISDEFFTMDIKGASWDSRQIITLFDEDKNANVNERKEAQIDDQNNPSSDVFFDLINIAIVYSAATEFTKYHCSLSEEFQFEDTFIYQTRNIEFKLENIGKVPLKITWSFIFDEEFPIKINKCNDTDNPIANNFHNAEDFGRQEVSGDGGASKETLFSECSDRESVDTWFEVDLPFKIEPGKDCLKPKEVRIFKISFSPLEAFMYNVRLRSVIDNLDPYDQVITSKIQAKSLIPYVHLDIEESDYLTSGRRKNTKMTLPQHTTVLEFNVLGWGCYKKTFNIINPTKEGYEFIFEMIASENPVLVPVHCDMLKGFVEGGTSTEVTFTFAPTVHGVYESQWKFIIPSHALEQSLLVVGTVREPAVNFVPTILVIRNSLVGFTTRSTVLLKNNESESLNFEFKGTSLFYEKGETPVLVDPEKGVLKARHETPINVTYTPMEDGPLSFKIFCNISYLSKPLTLCVNALSYSISPTVLYYFIGNEYELKSGVATDIHLEQTASTYERTIPFTIKNDGSATFCFDWRYNTSSIKKYLQLYVKPSSGHVTPASKIECVLHFTLKQVPVQNFPVTLSISDGPEYNIFLHAKIEKPLYHFSCMEYNFGKCIVHAPDSTYKKIIVFENEDMVPITLELNFTTLPELLVQCSKDKKSIKPKQKTNIAIYFRPKQIKEYKFYLEFWVNSLCKEIITIEGEGIPLLFDLYEGCQKSYDLGPVKIGEKSTCQIEVMNHSKVPITASFIFRYMWSALEDNTNSEGTSVCLSPTTAKPQENEPSRLLMLQQYRDSQLPDLTAQDIQNVLSSVRVVPKKCTIKPHRKVPLKIHFNPVQMVKALNVQLNMKVLHVEKPLVRLIGSATGMSLCLSPNALQFGSMRKRGCKILKVMLLNKGDFGASFFWEPLPSNEFTISPMKGNIAAQSAFTFTVTFQPLDNNPFIKVWARCNIENYHILELALYGACMEIANVQNKTIHMECPVREIKTEIVVVTNPSDDMWLIVSEDSGGPFDTLKEFHISPNSTFDIPIHFKPTIMGKYESRVLFFPLGQSSLLITLIGNALPPNPNGVISIAVPAKEFHTEELLVHNITENLESYVVSTELVKVIPDKFQGYYEIKCPDTIKVWGEAAATCRWTFVCYEECQMMIKVVFINEETLEYQFYNIEINVTASKIVDTLTFVCRARESSKKELVIRNPLSTEADFLIRCDRLTCPESLRILGNSEETLSMVYSPLVVGETQDYLEVKNNLIGTLYYVVILECLPANEKNLELTTTLGSLIPLRLRVQNRTNAQAQFKTSDCSSIKNNNIKSHAVTFGGTPVGLGDKNVKVIFDLSHPSIVAESKYVLGPQEKGKFQAWFEPTELGVQFCKVSFNSIDAGEFIFNIRGVAEEPKPQGPFKIKAGGSRTITFKNVFENTQTFKINIDREDFSVKTSYETIKSKKDAKVTVYLNDKPADGWATLPTGCLTITPSEPATPKVQWMYFLQGVL